MLKCDWKHHLARHQKSERPVLRAEAGSGCGFRLRRQVAASDKRKVALINEKITKDLQVHLKTQRGQRYRTPNPPEPNCKTIRSVCGSSTKSSEGIGMPQWGEQQPKRAH